MKATERYFPVVLFIMLNNMHQTFESVAEALGGTIQMKPIEKNLSVVLFVVLYKMVLTL